MTTKQLLASLTAKERQDLIASGKLYAVLAAYNQHHDLRGSSGLEILTPTNGKPR